MMSKMTIVHTIVIAGIFSPACSLTSLRNQTDLEESSPIVYANNGRTYHCAANSLYCLSRRSDIEISYQTCVELLPITTRGNSMLEFKEALESLGFNVEAQRLTAEELANI